MIEGMEPELADIKMSQYVDAEGRPKNTAALQEAASIEKRLGVGERPVDEGFHQALKTEIAKEELSPFLAPISLALSAETYAEAEQYFKRAWEEKKSLDAAYDRLQQAE